MILNSPVIKIFSRGWYAIFLLCPNMFFPINERQIQSIKTRTVRLIFFFHKDVAKLQFKQMVYGFFLP